MGPEMAGDSSADSPAIEKFIAPGQRSHDQQPPQPPNILGSNHNVAVEKPGADGARYYTIQRVNGNGANGKGDGTAGGHKHSIDESDKVKKNSIHRHFLKEEREKRKSLVNIFQFCRSDFHCHSKRLHTLEAATSFLPKPDTPHRHRKHHLNLESKQAVNTIKTLPFCKTFRSSFFYRAFNLSIHRSMSENANSKQKTYHKKATGIALNTVKKHAKEHDLKLYGSCFWYVFLFLSFCVCASSPNKSSHQSLRPASLDLAGGQRSQLSVHRG